MRLPASWGDRTSGLGVLCTPKPDPAGATPNARHVAAGSIAQGAVRRSAAPGASRQLATLLEGDADRCGIYLGDHEHRRSMETRTAIGKRRMVVSLQLAGSLQKMKLREAIRRDAKRPSRFYPCPQPVLWPIPSQHLKGTEEDDSRQN